MLLLLRIICLKSRLYASVIFTGRVFRKGCRMMSRKTVLAMNICKRFRIFPVQPLSTLDERCFGVRVGNPELLRILNRGIYELGYDFGINVSYNYTDGLYKYSIFDFLGDNIGLVLFCSFFVILLIVLFFIRRQIRLKKQTEKDRKTQFELQSASATAIFRMSTL